MLATVEQLQDRYYLGVKVAGIGLGTVDFVADTITLDKRAAALFDLPADVAIPRHDLHARIHPEDWATLKYKVSELLDHDGAQFFEVVHRIVHGNGDIVWVNARKQIEFAKSPDGSDMVPVSGLVAIIDLTEHKKDQERVQFLLEELNHRSKNMLAVVQSIARRTFVSGDMDSFPERFNDRLVGLARNYDAMVKGAWQYADLSELVTSHISGFDDAAGRRVSLDGPIVKISPKEAQAIGLAFHELATNASKYGALSVETGAVAVRWQVGSDGRLTITWTERGGPEVQAPSRTGFGTKVIKDMAEASLAGSVDVLYRPEGVFWKLIYNPEDIS